MKTPFVNMKPTALLCSLVFVGLTGSAQAATWTIDSGSVNGMRVGAISFDGLPAGVEIGNINADIHAAQGFTTRGELNFGPQILKIA